MYRYEIYVLSVHTLSLALLQASAFFSVQCQLFTLVASGLSSTIHLGSPSPHLAILVLKQIEACYTDRFPVTQNTAILENSTTLYSIRSTGAALLLLSVVSCTTTDYTTDYTRPPARDHRNHRRSSHIDINNNTVVNLLHILHWEITYMIYQNIRRNTFSTQKYFLPLKCILLYDVIYISLNSIDNGARDVLIKAHCDCQL